MRAVTAGERRGVRLGAVAAEPVRCDKEGNAALAERLVGACAAERAELVVLPEGFLEGYVVNEEGMTRERFIELAEPMDGPYVARFRALARRHGVWLLACFAERGEVRSVRNDAASGPEVERKEPLVYNTALLIGSDGGVVGKYRKTHVQSGGDWKFYAPGESLPVFETPWGKVGVMICYDRQFPEVPRTLMRRGARLVLNPSWGMFGELNETMMRTRAYENGVFIVFAHVKGALVFGPRGDVVARSASGEETLVCEVNLGETEAVRDRPRGHLTDHLRPELYTAADESLA